jgi:hypothetical protein
MRLFPLSILDLLRGPDLEPAPEIDDLAQRHARTLREDLAHDPDHFEVHQDSAGAIYHVDRQPAAEDLIALRITAAIVEDRAGRARP